jgi:hypothetical protein
MNIRKCYAHNQLSASVSGFHLKFDADNEHSGRKFENFSNGTLLQNSIEIARRGECQGMTSVVPEEQQKHVGL